MLTNADDGTPEYYVRQVFNWVAPAIKKPTAPSPRVARVNLAWEQCVGTYHNPWGDIAVLLLNGELVVIKPTLDNPKDSILRLIPEGHHTFRVTAAKKHSGAIGELAVFEFGRNGHVMRMPGSENSTDRLD